MTDERDVVIDLVCHTDIALARSIVRQRVTNGLRIAADDPFTIDTMLATSELVSNALEHAHGRCTMRVTLSCHAVRVEVADLDASAHLTAAMPPPEAQNGRGLAIVETIATRWGTERSPQGKTVWFEIERNSH